jgi:hypothetical protein
MWWVERRAIKPVYERHPTPFVEKVERIACKSRAGYSECSVNTGREHRDDTGKGRAVMDRFNKLSHGMKLMLVGSVLLLISTFFAWQDYGDLGLLTRNAWHGLGFVMGLLTIVLIAWLVARLAAVDVPVPVSLTGAVLAFLIFACALIVNLVDDYSTFWSYLGVAFAALIAVGAWMQVQEAGGIDNLKSEVPNMPSSSESTSAAPAAPPAAPAAPEPPAAPEAADAPVDTPDETTT